MWIQSMMPWNFGHHLKVQICSHAWLTIDHVLIMISTGMLTGYIQLRIHKIEIQFESLGTTNACSLRQKLKVSGQPQPIHLCAKVNENPWYTLRMARESQPRWPIQGCGIFGSWSFPWAAQWSLRTRSWSPEGMYAYKEPPSWYIVNFNRWMLIALLIKVRWLCYLIL